MSGPRAIEPDAAASREEALGDRRCHGGAGGRRVRDGLVLGRLGRVRRLCCSDVGGFDGPRSAASAAVRGDADAGRAGGVVCGVVHAHRMGAGPAAGPGVHRRLGVPREKRRRRACGGRG